MNFTKKLSMIEFVTLMALLMSLAALAIDAMLPALPNIAEDLNVVGGNQVQTVVGFVFLGLGLGQIFYGPISDSIGRKVPMCIGIGVFILGCFISYVSKSFWVMLIGRVLQGFGAAGPKIITVALVRDEYKGEAMARIMSLMMSVFIVVPALAPLLGQGILLIADWRSIFFALLGLAIIGFVWFFWRQPETLVEEKRRDFSWSVIFSSFYEACTHPVVLVYTLAAGCVTGAFIGYLSSVQQIFQIQYGLVEMFPLFFGVLALSIGSASVVNARLVMHLGMRRLILMALKMMVGLSLVFFIFAYGQNGQPNLWIFMLYMLPMFFCVGILFGNFSALAIEPMGHIAGMAASVIGSLQTLISMVLGIAIGQMYDGTILPLVGGFLVLGGISLGLVLLVGKLNKISRLRDNL